MKKLFILFSLSIISLMAYAQHSHVAYLALADSLYSYHNYGEATTYYQRALKNAKQPGGIMLKIARAYGKMNNAKEAEPWYLKAKKNNALFSNEDTYHYAKALLTLQKRKEAESVLADLLQADPNVLVAKQLLDDLQNVGKYYSDSSACVVTPLSLNTSVAEFAPEYYKDGLVYSSAQPPFITHKKYHWDNTHFLNLYYSAKLTDHNFKKPEVFDKELNTRFHDGPVSFYAGGEKMILNRNQEASKNGKQVISMSHLSLFDVKRNADNKTWDVVLLPFDRPPYSFGHPCVSEDGNILYFISDIPEGYGGTDIYRVIRTNDEWSEPINVGPTINTSENEVFPFLINNTLYFASDGHGGLGGFDLFKSTASTNGFTPPVNLGYPFNSRADDFSLITTGDEQTGYFASARHGNDDLFEFRKAKQFIHLVARVYDDATKESLPGSSVTLISSSAEDIVLTSGEGGKVPFQLAPGSAYVLIASHQGKTGMFAGEAIQEDDQQHKVHPLPVLGDTMSIACVGKIQDEHGKAHNASTVNIIDETTGKKILSIRQQSIVNFSGEKGHRYRIEIQNSNGDTTVHQLEIKPEDTGLKTWVMEVKETETVFTLAARVFNAESGVPLSNANVKLISFSSGDLELVADDKGIVEFSLPKDAAYVLIGSKDGLTGMNSGIVERETSKQSIVHPVPARGDSLHRVPVVALVTNTKGEILRDAKATITDKATGESVPGEIKDGILIFFGEQGKSYSINVEEDGYLPSLQELSIDKGVKSVEKIAVVMQEIKNATYVIAVKLFKEEDQSPVTGASAKIISFSKPDMELVADEQGIIEFSMEEGEGYIVFGKKDQLLGMHTGIASPDTDKNSIVHPLGLSDDPASTLDIFGIVKNAAGEPISNADVQVVDTQTGESIPAKIEDGILSFQGKRGGHYRVTVSAENYATQEKIIPLDSTTTLGEPLIVTLDKKFLVDVNVASKSGEMLEDVEVTIIDKQTGQKVATEKKNGVLTFVGEQGKEYTIAAKNGHQTAVEEFSIPSLAESVDPVTLVLSEGTVSITSLITDESGKPVNKADVTVSDVVTGEKISATIENGVLSFTGKKGASYKIEVNADGYESQQKQVSIDPTASTSPKIDIQLQSVKVTELTITSLIADESGKPVNHAVVEVTDIATGEKVDTKIANGLLSFNGKKGRDYKIEVCADGYASQEKQIDIDSTASTPPAGEIKLQALMPIAQRMGVHVFRESDNSPLDGAEVKIMSFSETDIELRADSVGVAEFNLPDQSPFVVAVTKDGYVGMYVGIAEHGTSKTSTLHPVPANNDPTKPLVVFGFVADEFRKPLVDAEVSVIDLSTGQEIPSKIENGILSYSGKRGGAYKVAVKADGYEQQERSVNIDPNAFTIQPLEIRMQRNKADAYSMAARVFKASDNMPLEGAEVTIMSFQTGDLELNANSEGVVEFNLPEKASYIIIATKDDYLGMHSGIVEAGTDKKYVTHPVPASNILNKSLPVLALVADMNAKPLTQAKVIVTDLTAGRQVEAEIEHGILSFHGERGSDYKIEITSEDYDPQVEKIKIDPNALFVRPLEISMTRKKLFVLPPASDLIILNNETPRVYITSNDSHDEIIEENGVLFLVNKDGSNLIGNGSLSDLVKDPSRTIALTEDQIVTLQNIYFDFNSAMLDDTDRQELEKAKSLLKKYPLLQLTVRAHADLRGSSTYNMTLTRKRARTIKSYLVKRGISSRNVSPKAYGKSAPLIVCETQECTEQQHQKNRRAEFELATARRAPVEPFAVVKPPSTAAKSTIRTRVNPNYAKLISKYGDIQHQDLVFKVCVGAYKLNPNLTFTELTDLGLIEKQLVGGINYYYLQDFATLKAAETVRQQVLQRGISDAYITIFYNGKKISFSEFISIANN